VDHKEQHHEHHRKEREHEKKLQKEHEHQEEKSALPFHPAWLVILGAVGVLVAIIIYTVMS